MIYYFVYKSTEMIAYYNQMQEAVTSIEEWMTEMLITRSKTHQHP